MAIAVAVFITVLLDGEEARHRLTAAAKGLTFHAKRIVGTASCVSGERLER